MQQPEWATPIIKEVCASHRRKLPKMKWIQRNRHSTSGVTYTHSKQITMCLGNDDQRHLPILLHELAHYVCPRRSHHNKRFWLKLGVLLKQYNCYSEVHISSEHGYMAKAKRYLVLE